MVKSAENRMRSNLELLPLMNVKSRPEYISALKKVVPDISRPKKSRHYFDALNGREIGRSFLIREHSWRACFNRWKEHPYIVLQYTPKSTQK